MTTVTFDTLEFTRKLRDAGFDEKQAEAVVRVVSDAQSGFVTRDHFDSRITLLESKVDAKFAVVDAKFDKMTWMISALIAIAAANFAKQFF